VKTAAIIVAAGQSERFGGGLPKQFRALAGRPLLAWTIERFEKATSIDSITLVVAEEHLLYAGEKVVDPFGFHKVTRIVPGGEVRRESVLKGLERLPLSTGLVAIHDGARPLVSPADIDAVVALAAKERAAMLAAPVTDTVKRVKEGYVMSTLERNALYLAQTPQAFQYDLILKAHRQANESGLDVTDDAALVERLGFKVRVVEPSRPNFKITRREDLIAAEAFLKEARDD
jgi:2-C-methyl-D-erythritol 4-phosphate cytidylyltransferase